MAYLGTSVSPLGDDDYESGIGMSSTFDTLKGAVFSDTPGTLFIEQGFRDDEGNMWWDLSKEVTITASTGQGFGEELLLPFWRIRFEGTGTNEAFRIFAVARATGFVGG